MRGTRWLLLVAIAAMLGGVGWIYRERGRIIRAEAPPRPAALPNDLNSSSQNWTFIESASAYTKVEVSAGDMLEAKDGSRVDLKKLTLKLHNKNGKTYDLVTSDAATLFKADNRFFSEGEVTMVLDVPEQGAPGKAPVTVRSSGVTFDMDAGRIETDRATHFTFRDGAGDAIGARYDTNTRQLLMKQDVRIDWKPSRPHAKPTRIEAGSLEYHEAESEILLRPWGRLTRENTQVEGQNATIHLQEDNEGHRTIRKVDATMAHGTDSYPRRKLEYSADEMWMDFDEDGAVHKITGQTNAHLSAVSDTAETTVAAYHVEMDFAGADGESSLTAVNSTGDSVVSSKPLPAPGRQLAESHVLRSNTIEMKMREGGREIETVTTHTPSVLEFLPNLPVQHHRTLNSADMFIAYGPQNRVESFRAAGVRTQTDPTAEERKRNRGASVTASRTMTAQFDSKTSRLAAMEQSGDFTYQEGERKAHADRATFDAAQDVMQLETRAAVSDATGATSADHIRIDQSSGNFLAQGNVQSSRLPDAGEKKKSEMLSGDEPLHARARKMDSSNRNRKIHYEGAVTMWQGANRIQGEVVDLDRDKRTLVADGNVVTNLWEQPKDDAKKKAGPPVLTEVRAAHLVYTEDGRLAHYTGGVALDRPNLQVRSRELQAYLSDSGGDSRLDKALADGDVKIHQSSKDRSRTGTAEHSEYYTADQKIILTGGMPKLADSKGNTTVGPEGLTYFANDDTLLVKGSAGQPAKSRVESKTKKSR